MNLHPFLVARARNLLVSAMIAALVGCSTFRGHPEPASDRSADLAALQKQSAPDRVDECLNKPTDDCRSRIVRARRAAEDIRFYEFEERVFSEGRTTGFFATLATLGLTTASAASSGGTAQVLAGLAAVLTGAREAYQKEVLAEKTVQAIFTTMRGNRAEVELRIRSGLRLPYQLYSLEDGISDLEAYRRAGTVQGGLDTITELAGVKTRQAEFELKEKLSFKPDAAAQKLRLLVCGSSPNCLNLNMVEIQRMKKDCWTKAGVPSDTLLLDFMLQESFARQRALVGACMVPD